MSVRLVLVARAAALAALVALATGPLAAQAPGAQAASPAGAVAPAARPSDVESVDAIVAALYDVISGPAGQARDWNRFQSLFAPGARLIPTGRTAAGVGRMQVLTPAEYIERARATLERDGFFEREIGRRQQRFGNVVHVMSAYDSKRTLADARPFARGINSIQLWFDGNRWWVVTVYWQAETEDTPIPAEYLTPSTSVP